MFVSLPVVSCWTGFNTKVPILSLPWFVAEKEYSWAAGISSSGKNIFDTPVPLIPPIAVAFELKM